MNIDPESLARTRYTAMRAASLDLDYCTVETRDVLALIDEIERFRAENAKINDLRNNVIEGTRGALAAVREREIPKPRPMPTDRWQPMPTVVHE